MCDIITPLDNILDLISDLNTSSHTNRRGSNVENIYAKIASNVRDAKNNIIKHLLGEKKNGPTKNTQSKATYAQSLNSNGALNNIIIPVGETKPNYETVADVEKRVNAALGSSNHTIVKTISTESGKVILKVQDSENTSPLKETLAAEFGNSVKIQKPLLPKIKVVSVPNFFDTNDKPTIVTHILKNNQNLQKIFEKNPEALQFLFSYNVNGHKSLILKCTPEMRVALKEQNDYINIEHFKCKIYDRIHVTQCSNCTKFGHSNKDCKFETPTCTYCSKNHSFKDCPDKNSTDKHSCNNCLKHNDTSIKDGAQSHDSFSKKCPLYFSEKAKIIARTDFGFNYTNTDT